MVLKWNTFAGGTSAHHGYSYSARTPEGEFHIWAPSRRHGGYHLQRFGFGESWRDMGSFRSPQAAKSAAKEFVEARKTARPLLENPARVTLKQISRVAGEVQSAQQNYGERSQNYLNAMVRWSEIIQEYARQNPGKKLPANPFLRNPREMRRSRREALERRDALPFKIQASKNGAWKTVGAFASKLEAVKIGRTVARRYPKQKFRVAWEGDDTKKNPAPRRLDAAPEVRQAAKLHEDFKGRRPTKVRTARLPTHKAAVDIGPVIAVAYETTRDGKRENYLHEFRRGARPTLAASHDGRNLYLLGGAYRFTERGIIDK